MHPAKFRPGDRVRRVGRYTYREAADCSEEEAHLSKSGEIVSVESRDMRWRDTTYLVRWDSATGDYFTDEEHPEAFIDQDCLVLEEVTEEEMQEALRSLGVT